MDPEAVPRLVLAIFVVALALALGSVVTGWNLSALIDPLAELFVPVFLLAVFIALVLYVINEFT